MPPSTLATSAPVRSAPTLPSTGPAQPAADGRPSDRTPVFVDRTGRRHRLMGRLGVLAVLPAVAFGGILGVSAVNGPPVRQPATSAERADTTATLLAGRRMDPAAEPPTEWSGVPTWEPPQHTDGPHGDHGTRHHRAVQPGRR